jgi:predicted enzyme related to lactoylglutathione lyase
VSASIPFVSACPPDDPDRTDEEQHVPTTRKDRVVVTRFDATCIPSRRETSTTALPRHKEAFPMLTEAHAVLPASDLKRAQEFYHSALEFDPTEASEDGNLIYRLGSGTGFEIYETSNAGTAQNTQMCFLTDAFESDMAQMRARGVVFEDYDFPGLKTENGVATTGASRAAWFRDSEGNYICLTEDM